MEEEEIDCEFTTELVCPHCGEEIGDSFELPDSGEHSCYNCGRKFSYLREIEITYTSTKL